MFVDLVCVCGFCVCLWILCVFVDLVFLLFSCPRLTGAIKESCLLIKEPFSEEIPFIGLSFLAFEASLEAAHAAAMEA